MTMTASRATTASEFRRHIDETGQLPDDVILGYIAYFGVADGEYDGDKMEAEFDRLGLNKAFLPKGINPVNAYEKASKDVHGVKYEVAGGNMAELMTRELTRDNERIERWIMREVKDQNQKRLLYNEVAAVTFFKPPVRKGQIDYSGARVKAMIFPGVSDSERTIVQGMLDRILAAYDRYVRFHDGQRVRAIVRQYLLHLNAIQMKPSVYFVHHNRSQELHNLQTFVNNLGDGTSMSLLPLADLPTLRTDVTEAFQRESEKAFAAIVKEISDLRATRSGSIGMTAFLKVRKQFDDELQRASEHSRTFQVSQAHTAAASEMALMALNQLQEQVVQGMAPPATPGAA